MIRSIAILVFCTACSVCNAAPIQCSGDAIAQAKKLLVFHFGPDDRIDIDPSVKELPSMVNQANKKQKFRVLEVWGSIYKGQYRMRFIYFSPTSSDCTLMGQEILEYASL